MYCIQLQLWFPFRFIVQLFLGAVGRVNSKVIKLLTNSHAEAIAVTYSYPVIIIPYYIHKILAAKNG